ncbi:hypothetical protein M408DRAFT_232965 [Serendipita vermifera MAFF 305830]|nr:hypothetical protein M408DRAFT_232965 [Serendipita vermifera MAFF 305830]
MDSIDFEARSHILQLMVRLLVNLTQYPFLGPAMGAERVGWLFTHQHGTGSIIKDMARKWDYERDCPFPEGVERKADDDEMTEEIVWVKSGLPYVREA